MYAIASMPYWEGMPGLGASSAPVSTQIESGAAGSLLSVAPFTGPAAPFVAAAGAIAGLLATLGVGAGCGQACIQATNLVNQAEPALLQNLQAYENGEIDQATALSNYQQIWQSIQTACSAIPGGAGKSCVTDRQAGACTWKATGTPPTPSSPAPGTCWNWDNAYRVPLTYPPINAPAPSASSDVSAVTGDVGSALSTVGLSSSYAVPLLIGAAALAIWAVMG
jgi:hypothetical protein